ncbi:MAG TPA: hypothetical protein VL126_13180 [Bacteroidota bacterium]|nr:hypothetical protein [Bacteroidota bacterium]
MLQSIQGIKASGIGFQAEKPAAQDQTIYTLQHVIEALLQLWPRPIRS